VSFFQRPPPPPSAPGDPGEPPADVLPGVVPVQLIVGRNENAVVAVDGIWAYPAGLRLRVWAVRRDDPSPGPPAINDRVSGLAFGVAFADGGRATVPDLGSAPPSAAGVQPVLRGLIGRGAGGHWHQDLWLTPFPPPPTLDIVCEWPAAGLAESKVQVSVDLLRQAAGQAVSVWDDDPRPDQPGGSPG